MGGPGPARILLIDDDEDERVLTRDLLGEMRSQFELEWEGTYDGGLERLLREDFACCLVDYQLGARNGVDLIQEAHRRGCQAPMILLTGHDDREVDLEALRAGAADYVSKRDLTAGVLERSLLYAIARRAASQARDDLAVAERSRELVAEEVTEYAIFRMDAEGKVASWNAGAQRLKGYRPDEIVGRPVSRFYTPEDLAAGRHERLLRTAREHGRAEDESWSVRKDGSRFWANVVVTAVRAPGGGLRGYVVVSRDVTEQRRVTFLGEASAILTSSLDYQTTLSQVAKLCVPFLADWCSLKILERGALNAVAVMHPDPAKAALGLDLERRFPEDPATGPTWKVVRTGRAWLSPEFSDRLWDDLVPNAEHRELLKKLGVRSGMIVPLMAQGRTFGALTLLAAESGRRYGPADLQFAEDLGRRCGQAIDNARTHAALRVEREFLDGVVREMREGVIVAEASGNLILANDQALRILGASSIAELHGSPLAYIDAQGRPLSPSQFPLQRALRTGETVPTEEISFTHADELRTVSVTAAPVRDHQHRLLGAVATFREVTAQKRAEARAAQEAESRELFFGILGHDLRNPLSAIVTASHVLLRKGLSEPDARIVGRIASSADRMRKLIADLLDLTRARLAGGIPVTRRPEKLAPLCRRVVEEIAIARPECEIQFDAHGDPLAEVDPDRIAQAVSNLVGNAADHGCGHPIQVTLGETADAVTLEVHNRGAPIPAELLSVIFDPFQRAASQPPGSSGRQGLGLGLYITQEIVRRHGGTISVSSTHEDGTRFRVVLPKHLAA